MIKAVIFDMDGVLLDSEPFWKKAEQMVFAKVGLNLTDDDCEQTVGMRIDEVVEFWHRKQPWKQKPKHEVVKEIIEGVKEQIYDNAIALPGVHSLLELLKIKEIKIGLASSSSKTLIIAVITKLKIGEYFEVLKSAEDEVYGKPHPAVYLSAAQQLGVEPYECLVIEDSVTGMISGKAAGMKVLVVPPKHLLNDKRYGVADYTLDSLERFNQSLLT